MVVLAMELAAQYFLTFFFSADKDFIILLSPQYVRQNRTGTSTDKNKLLLKINAPL